MDNQWSLSVVAALLGSCCIVSSLYKTILSRSKLRHIPVVGQSGILSSYLGAWRFLFHSKEMIEEGYKKYSGSVFRVPMISRWMIVVGGRRMIDDIRKATDDELSFKEAVAETIQTEYTLGPEITESLYHITVVRSHLTRNLGSRFHDLQDEVRAAFNDYIPLTKDWIKVSALETSVHMVCRSSNRLFVGLPLCRDPDYRDLLEAFAVYVIKASHIINIFPSFLRPLVGKLLTDVPRSVQRVQAHLAPIIKERLEMEENYGRNWPEKPNDLISWLLEEAEGPQKSIRDLTLRVLTINFAAIHTTSIAFTDALYDLAAYPSYVSELREEVETIIDEEGLTKVSLDKMFKLDSFLKESKRMHGNGSLVMERKVLKDFAFSDGTVVPAGNTISVAINSTHHDEAYYENPHEFDGFRFAKTKEDDDEGFQRQVTTTSSDYVVFGHGRHACPGRYLAALEIKLMMVHVLLNYDVKFEDGIRPPEDWFMIHSAPNRKASVMFRTRFS